MPYPFHYGVLFLHFIVQLVNVIQLECSHPFKIVGDANGQAMQRNMPFNALPLEDTITVQFEKCLYKG